MASSKPTAGVTATVSPYSDECMMLSSRPSTKRTSKTQRIINSWKSASSTSGFSNAQKKLTTHATNAANDERQTGTSPSNVCSLCKESGTKCFLCDGLPNICSVCDKSCKAVDLRVIPELPRHIHSKTEQMPEFCKTCFKKMEPAELYSRLLPALDDNDRQTGESTVGLEYPGMGYVLDSGYLQIIYPHEKLRVAKHPEVLSPEIVGKGEGPEERSKKESLSERQRIALMGRVTDQMAAAKRGMRQERRQKKFTQRLKVLQQHIR